MGDHIHKQTIPRAALIGAAFLMVGSMSLAAGARHVHRSTPAAAVPAPIQVRELRFEDRPDGSLAAIDTKTGDVAGIVAPGTNGFVRGVLRGMFRNRKLESLGHDAHFRLAREADNHLTLEDPDTRRHVDLDSFGPTNSAAFARFLGPSLVSSLGPGAAAP